MRKTMIFCVFFLLVTTNCADDEGEAPIKRCPTDRERRKCDNLVDRKEWQQVLTRVASGCEADGDCTSIQLSSCPAHLARVNKANKKQFYSEWVRVFKPQSQCLSQYEDCINSIACPDVEPLPSKCLDGQCIGGEHMPPEH